MILFQPSCSGTCSTGQSRILRRISKKKIYIAGSLPAQNNTYVLDQRNNSDIEKNFYDQAKLLKPFIDFYYLDVLCGSKECEIALNVTEKLNLPVLVGLHVKKNGKLPSKESISDVVNKCKNKNWLGLIVACSSPEIILSHIVYLFFL